MSDSSFHITASEFISMVTEAVSDSVGDYASDDYRWHPEDIGVIVSSAASNLGVALSKLSEIRSGRGRMAER